jgi:hypothetical protein
VFVRRGCEHLSTTERLRIARARAPCHQPQDTQLCDSVAANVATLDELEPSYWRSGRLLLADAAFAALLVALIALIIATAV